MNLISRSLYKELAKWAILSLSLFILGTIIGWWSFSSYIAPDQSVTNFAINKQNFFVNVLVNNLGVAFFLLIGSLSFGVITALVIIYSGFITGFYFLLSVHSYDINLAVIMFLPHGIIEIIWVLLFASISFFIGSKLASIFFKEQEKSIFNQKELILEIIKLSLIGLIILAFGVLIESYFSIEMAKKLVAHLAK